MKKTNKILCLLLIIPLFAICLVGCEKKELGTIETITLTQSNYKDYLAINASIVDVEDSPYTNTTDVRNGYLIISYKVLISPARPNLIFNNCSFKLLTNYYDDYEDEYFKRTIYLDYKGNAETYYIRWSIYLEDIQTFGTESGIPDKVEALNLFRPTLSDFSGTVTIGE